MVGFLLQDDAQNAQQSVIDDFRRRADELMGGAQQQVSSLFQPAPAPPPVQQPPPQPEPSNPALDQFRQQADRLMSNVGGLFQQQPAPASAPGPQPIAPAPTAPDPNSALEEFRRMADGVMSGSPPPLSPPVAPAPVAPMPQAPSLEPAHEPTGPTTITPVNDKWSTSFDFGQTYTGAYRTGTPHRGIDLIPRGGGGIGTEVDAFTPGTVTNIARDSGAGGLMVYVQDDHGLTHAYMHLADTAPGLAVGQRVDRGTPIATMGESGTEGSPHLHYEVRKNAATGDPLNQLIDPRPYMAGSQGMNTGVQTTAGMSGGGAQSGQVGQRGQDILSGAADIASWLGEQGQKALQAILITEGGLNNARGDNGQSAGPLQFFEGGQLANFARATGQTLQDAKTYVEQHPLEAIRWAIGTPTNPGYLGMAIAKGIQQNMAGPDLATFAQRTGQVSESPERAGANWQALFGGGQQLISSGVDVGRQIAQGSENLVRSGSDLVNQTSDTLRNQFANLQGQGTSRAQDLLRLLEDSAAQRGRDFEQTMAGFRAPDLPTPNVDQILDAGRNLPGVSDFLRGYAAGQQSTGGGGGFTPDFQARAAEVANAPMEAQGIGGLLGTGGNIVPPLTMPEWQNLNQRRREAVEQLNPLRDQPVVGGAINLAGDMLTDPTTYMLGGPLARLGGRVGGALSTNVPRALTTATRFAGDQATQGALYSALQAAETPGATPQDIAVAAAEGAALGGATGVGAAGLGALARGTGRLRAARVSAEEPVSAGTAAKDLGAMAEPDVSLPGPQPPSGAQTAQASPMFAARLGGAVGGIGANEARMSEEDKQDFWGRLSTDLAAGVAGAAAPGVARGLLDRVGPSYAELQPLRAAQPSLLTAPNQPGTLAQNVTAQTKDFLLSGPGTQITNIFSQLIELARSPAVRLASGREDEALAGLKVMAQAFPDALRNFGKAMASGRSQFQAPGALDRYSPVFRPFLRTLGATDDFFRTLGWAMGAGQEGQRLIRNNPGQNLSTLLGSNQAGIDQAGHKLARLSVFAEGNGPGQWLGDLKNRLLSATPQGPNPSLQERGRAYGLNALGMLLDAGVPFSGVVGRIFTAGGRRLPVVHELEQAARAIYGIAKGDEQGMADAMGAFLIGGIINSSIVSNIQNGNIRGPDDPEHPNGIRLGGQWFDYSGWGPYAFPIAEMAAVVEAARKEGNKPDPNHVKAIMNASFKAFANQFYAADLIKTLSQVGEGNAAGALGRVGTSYLDRYLPAGAMLRAATQVWDPILRDPSERFPQALWERYQQNIPVLSERLPAMPEMTSGRPEQRARSGGAGALLRMQTREASPIEREVFRLEQLGYSIPEPKRPPAQISYRGSSIPLSEAEQRALATSRGEMISQQLERYMDTPYWQQLTDDQKARILARVMNRTAERVPITWRRTTAPEEAQQRVAAGHRVLGRLEPVGVR